MLACRGLRERMDVIEPGCLGVFPLTIVSERRLGIDVSTVDVVVVQDNQRLDIRHRRRGFLHKAEVTILLNEVSN